MNFYKNISFSAKTFYGVRFEPGETKGVDGFINHTGMVRVFNVKPMPVKTKAIEEPVSTRKRKKLNEPDKESKEPEKVSVAENENNKITEIPKEEISNGNPS